MSNEEEIAKFEEECKAITSIDETKLKNIITRIVELEKENVKTKEYNDQEMIKAIRKIIEEEIGCY